MHISAVLLAGFAIAIICLILGVSGVFDGTPPNTPLDPKLSGPGQIADPSPGLFGPGTQYLYS